MKHLSPASAGKSTPTCEADDGELLSDFISRVRSMSSAKYRPAIGDDWSISTRVAQRQEERQSGIRRNREGDFYPMDCGTPFGQHQHGRVAPKRSAE